MTNDRDYGNCRDIARTKKAAINHDLKSQICSIQAKQLKRIKNKCVACNADKSDCDEIRDIEVNHDSYTHMCLVTGD